MHLRQRLFWGLIALGLFCGVACSSDPDGLATDTGPPHDTARPDTVGPADVPPPPLDVPADLTADSSPADAPEDVAWAPDAAPDAREDAGEDTREDATADAMRDDAVDDASPDVAMVERRYTFRAIAGASMGAASAIIAARHPDRFDLVGPLGGYIDMPYLFDYMTRRMSGGFCPMEQILAHLEDVHDPDAADVFCGPTPTHHPWQFPVDFNHWHFSRSGGNWHRGDYVAVLEDFLTTFGNLSGYNPESPVLAPGMTKAWFANPSCTDPVRAGFPTNLNREFNPDGHFDVITFCDDDYRGRCADGSAPDCATSTDECWQSQGAYQPVRAPRNPFRMAMAVDYNGNGQRDYGEPIVLNAMERFDDVGPDGCANALEDGAGGCRAEPQPEALLTDPNGDDYDPITNPWGREGDGLFQAGEPFLDFGLDGVAAPDEAAHDFGEGNGQFDLSPNLAALFAERDPRHLIQAMPAASLERLDWWFDGGKRDMLESAVGSLHTAGALLARGQEVRHYGAFVDAPDAVLPHVTTAGFLGSLARIDLSAAAIGKNVHIAYGDPDATPEAIRCQGNGEHVGDEDEIVQRLLLLVAWVGQRWPGIHPERGGGTEATLRRTLSVYSEPLQTRVRLGVHLPPGYLDASRADRRYPVLYFLHGHGMDLDTALAPLAALLQFAMLNGQLARFILVFPEGWCCFRDEETGLRECACFESDLPGHSDCVDPTCTGPHDDCAIRPIPNGRLVRECRRGNFFQNVVADRWAETDRLDVMRYEDSLLFLMDWVDANYRTMAPAIVRVPAPTTP